MGENSMARKNGLNRKEQLQCAKALTDGVPAKNIAKKFGTSVEVVKKFTQKALDEAAEKAAKRTSLQGKAAQNMKTKAAIVKEALKPEADTGFV
jgi:transposase